MPEFSLQFRETISELHKSNGLMGMLMQRDHSARTGLAVFLFFVRVREFACVVVGAHNMQGIDV